MGADALPGAVAPPDARLRGLGRLLRTRQWIKNVVCLAGVVLSGRVGVPGEDLRALAAVGVFCLAASAIYAANDVAHAHLDRQHPLKRHRPVAAGVVAPAAALGLSGVFGLGALAGAGALGSATLLIVALYLGLNTLYMFWLRAVALVDLLWLATSMTLRVLAGFTALRASPSPSPWLLETVLLLAVLFSLRQRRGELTMAGPGVLAHRPGLRALTPEFVDQMSALVGGGVLVTYSLFAQMGPVLLRPLAVLLLLYALFRLSRLNLDRPDPYYSLLSDGPLLAMVAASGLWVLLAVYGPWGH